MSKRILPAAWQPVYENYHFAPAVRHGDTVHFSGMIGLDLSTLSMLVEPEAQFKAATAIASFLCTAKPESISGCLPMG